MKILFVAPFFHPVKGGMEEHIFQLAKNLIKNGHNVEIITSNLSRKGKLKIKDETYQGIKIKRLKTIFKIGEFSPFFPSIFSEIGKSDADIIHIHGYRHPTNLIPFLTKKPCLITLHYPNYPKGLRNSINEIIIPLFDKIIGRFILRKYEKLIAITPIEAKWIMEKFDIKQNKVTVIPNGIPESYLKGNKTKLSFRKNYNIKKNEFIIFNLSRFHKSKGQELIIKSAKEFPNIKFIIAGSDSGYLNELINLKDKLKIKNLRIIEDIPENLKLNALKEANIFLFTSHYEGFGIVILEAFSQKTPVISSDSGPLPWVINNCGLLFEENNLDDLRKKLKLLIKDNKLRKKYSKLGYKRVKGFTWEKITQKLEKEYKDLLSI